MRLELCGAGFFNNNQEDIQQGIFHRGSYRPRASLVPGSEGSSHPVIFVVRGDLNLKSAQLRFEILTVLFTTTAHANYFFFFIMFSSQF